MADARLSFYDQIFEIYKKIVLALPVAKWGDEAVTSNEQLYNLIRDVT